MRVSGAFRQRLRGPLLSPADEGFEEAIRIWNGMIEKTPTLVVQPTGTADVVVAVNFARKNDLLLSAKGGGHNIAGTALAADGLTIDMSRLRWGYRRSRGTNRNSPGGLFPRRFRSRNPGPWPGRSGGFVSETGLAESTLGGGFGYLTRRFGWTVDNLLEVEIVTADGQAMDRVQSTESVIYLSGGKPASASALRTSPIVSRRTRSTCLQCWVCSPSQIRRRQDTRSRSIWIRSLGNEDSV